MMKVSGGQRRWLASRAHDVQPTVMVGKEGPTPGVLAQLKAELEVHELVKVRFVGHKEAVGEIAPVLADESDSLLVRTIGHVAVFFRPKDDSDQRRIVLPDL